MSTKQHTVDFISYTPKKASEKIIYKFYCPLCMNYCSRMNKSKCCTNYICNSCVRDILNLKPNKLLNCPFCSKNLYLENVAKDEPIRTYLDEQEVMLQSSVEEREQVLSNVISPYPDCSLHSTTNYEKESKEKDIFIAAQNVQKIKRPTSIKLKNKSLLSSNIIVPLDAVNITGKTPKRHVTLLLCFRATTND